MNANILMKRFIDSESERVKTGWRFFLSFHSDLKLYNCATNTVFQTFQTPQWLTVSVLCFIIVFHIVYNRACSCLFNVIKY